MQQSASGHANNFNLLRCIGAACVVFSHTYDVVGQSEREPLGIFTNGIIEFSGIGLTIFFFISGYFVTKSAFESSSVFSFLQKRILRIYPALIVLIFVSVFIAGPILTNLPLQEYFKNKETWQYLYTATGFRIRVALPGVFPSPPFFLNGFNASLWSIAVELQLYLSVTFFLLTGFLKNKKIFIFISGVIILTCFSILAFNTKISFNTTRLLNLISIFYMGSFIYTASLKAKHLKIILISAAVLYLFFLLLKLPGFNPFFLFLIALSLFIYFAGFTKRILLVLRTDISYGLYIYAFPVQQILFGLSGYIVSPVYLLIETFAVTTLLALASWHLIEKPFIALKHGKATS